MITSFSKDNNSKLYNQRNISYKTGYFSNLTKLAYYVIRAENNYFFLVKAKLLNIYIFF